MDKIANHLTDLLNFLNSLSADEFIGLMEYEQYKRELDRKELFEKLEKVKLEMELIMVLMKK